MSNATCGHTREGGTYCAECRPDLAHLFERRTANLDTTYVSRGPQTCQDFLALARLLRVALSRPLPLLEPDYAAAAKVMQARFRAIVQFDFDDDWLAIATDIVDAARGGGK